MRQRSEPWIHRWSKHIIVGLCIVGFSLTTYLTVTHFLGNKPALCTLEGAGCDLVLTSEYAKLFGIPLTVFGGLAYLTLGGLAAVPLFIKPENPKAQEDLNQKTSFLLFLVSTSTLIFSGYLMSLLAFVLKTPCPYCIGSAIDMAAIWFLNVIGRSWKNVGQLVFTGLLVSLITLTGTFGVYASQSKSIAVSQTYAGKLVQHLNATGAKMYGAYWCPHCNEQKEIFGNAAKQIPYIECDPKGEKSQTQLCIDKKVKSFPTWEINGTTYEGRRNLNELADLSSYKGSRE